MSKKNVQDRIHTVFAEDATKKLILSERKNKAKLWANLCKKTYDYKSNTNSAEGAEGARKLWQKDYAMQKELEHLYSKDTNEHNCLQFILTLIDMP